MFMGTVFHELSTLFGFSHIATVPYRPQGNGIVERFHGTLKPAIAKLSNSKLDWVEALPLALSAIRAIPNKSTGWGLLSPASLDTYLDLF